MAKIIAETNQQNAQRKRRELADSHYATVSDDSDEMYAAIDEPGGNQGELYTSGSETYAQIQPPIMTVSVEINTSQPESSSSTSHGQALNGGGGASAASTSTPLPPSIDSLKNQTQHSRQASASSCSSSLGHVGSPKPEKRQANSPLPPTPRSLHKSPASNSNSSNVTSGRNSSASVLEVSGVVGFGSLKDTKPGPEKKKSPSKDDVENMYAKVMKKSKLFSTASPVATATTNSSSNDLQNNNPDVFVSDPDIAKEINLPDFLSEALGASPGKASTKSAQIFDNNYETIDKKRNRSSSFNNKDPGYETIPAQKVRQGAAYAQSRLSAPAGALNEPGYESLPDRSLNFDPAYETLKRDSDYDPNYEVLRPSNASDDGYAKIQEKAVLRKSGELNDGYSSIKSVRKNLDNELGIFPLDGHGYAKIGDKRSLLNNNILDDDGSDIYSSIPSTTNNPPYATIREPTSSPRLRRSENGTSAVSDNFSSEAMHRMQQKLSECESLTGSDTDPNYETVRYLNVGGENPYERLQSSPGGTPSPISIEHSSLVTTKSNASNVSTDSSSNNRKREDVSDYFHV